MADDFDLGLFLVVVMVIEGIWLAGLTYLLLRRQKRRKEEKDAKAEEAPR